MCQKKTYTTFCDAQLPFFGKSKKQCQTENVSVTVKECKDECKRTGVVKKGDCKTPVCSLFYPNNTVNSVVECSPKTIVQGYGGEYFIEGNKITNRKWTDEIQKRRYTGHFNGHPEKKKLNILIDQLNNKLMIKGTNQVYQLHPIVEEKGKGVFGPYLIPLPKIKGEAKSYKDG